MKKTDGRGGKQACPPALPERTKQERELQADLDGCRLRLDQQKLHNTEMALRKDAIIARQRDWIVTLEQKLARALNELAEVKGETDDEDEV